MIVFTIEQEHKFYKALLTASCELRGSYDHIIIAGGACRDSLLDKDIKDYDVFVLNPSKTVANNLKKSPNTTQASRYKLGEPLNEEAVTYLETWNLGGGVQIILSSLKDIGELLATFDYDFCQIGFNTDQIHCTPVFEDFYMQDDEVNYVTLLNSSFADLKTQPSLKRLSKFSSKYTDYKFKDKEGTLLTGELLNKLGLSSYARIKAYSDIYKNIVGNPDGGVLGGDDLVVRDLRRPRRLMADAEAWRPQVVPEGIAEAAQDIRDLLR
jgi:hypothetical protein